MSTTVTRRVEHALQTRRALLEVAEEAFAEEGFGGVSIDEICRRARVTKGALYHHFEDKRDLFRAVYSQVERRSVGEVVGQLASVSDPWERCVAGLDLVLDHVLDERRQRILLVDGLAVLGAAEIRAIDMRQGFELLAATIGGAMEAGALERQPVYPLAHLILGAIREAALEIALSPDQAVARTEMGAALQRMIDGLRPIPHKES